MNERLNRQIEFIREIDKLKTIYRQSYLMDKSRHENDAEHTWHITLMAWLLEEHLDQRKVNLLRVMKMLLVHDLVEIDAGDTFAYDEKGQEGKFEREMAAAKRIFGLLPVDQRDEMLALWLEFEQRETLESRYAAAMDRIQPLLHNYFTGGKAWQEHGVTADRVRARIVFLQEDLPDLYSLVQHLIDDAVKQGYLRP
ncbi:HD domain-containing protein [Paenibacillus cellulositrophicus]|uniref:HD domain-containing protein n=1 Tax=Paenibacillus cellulositrophicus TaxID=562959 RepID=UPI00203A9B86|nr:HD domain-containing protein [Paenibacillus cellulositrophicus]MCM2997305.1 HD domain-containing protein [Paenibacillus cellulositrophicus]